MVPSSWSSMLIVLAIIITSSGSGINRRPVIGILQAKNITDLKYGSQVFTIMSVAFVKQAGGAAVPIFTDQTDEYYDQLFSRLNGLYLPGGASDILRSEYAYIAQKGFKIAKEMNDRGVHFPIWGVCLGLQAMASWAFEPRSNPTHICNGVNPKMMTLNFTEDAKTSRLLSNAPSELYTALQNDALAGHFHKHGVSTAMYKMNERFQKEFKVLSTNHDENGVEFISTMEARGYPFYSMQWHPEKVHFMSRLVAAKDLEQPQSAFAMNKYFSNFLMEEANKNNNTFLSAAEEERFLFDQYETQELFQGSLRRVSFANFEAPYFDDVDGLCKADCLLLPGMNHLAVAESASIMLFTHNDIDHVIKFSDHDI